MSIFEQGQKYPKPMSEQRAAIADRKPKAKPPNDDAKPDKPPVVTPSEDALALTLASRFDGELRYISPWGKWLKWTGEKWRIENTLAVFDIARKICRENYVGASLRARVVAAVELMARSDRCFAATTEEFDSNPWLFNTPDCTIDLVTGERRAHQPLDYITKIAGTSPSYDGCPLFFRFLKTIFDGDSDLIGYLQTFFGYVLTGETREHAMLFFYGTGSNGKSVLLSTIAGILGDYHRVAPMETFVASHYPRHSTDMAGLMGARLVTATETEENRYWAEAKIKALTGGDKISAQFMRQDYFEYTPAFKLIVAGNHKPALHSVDEAMRRRLHVIPFNVTIPAPERDPSLAERLKDEWPGILQWMLIGCATWQDDGLQPPQSVLDASAQYLATEDAVARWVAERCELRSGFEDTFAKVFASWKAWALLMGEPALSSRAFGEKLFGRFGVTRMEKGNAHVTFCCGIRVVEAEPAQSDWVA
jgi:putative DNA primase/helicase